MKTEGVEKGLESLVARAYIRVSTDEQATAGFSLPAQRERLEQFAKSQGWTVAKVYEDDGYSAKDTNRPALQQMLKDAQKGEVILAYKLDRLTRSVMDLYELMRTFDTRGLLFKSATEEFNTTTSHGRLMITLVAVLAQWERETIAERVKMGRQKKATTGEWPGGPIPFGYRAVPGPVRGSRHLKQLVPDEEHAHLVREIFDRYLGGLGVRGLCQWLNEGLKLPASNGGMWRPVTLRRLLTNPVYRGDIVSGRRTNGPEVVAKGNHEAIVPPALFDEVARTFEMRKGLPPRHATGKYPLAGIAKCGECGGPISALGMGREGSYYYRCLNYVQGIGCGDRPLTSFPGRIAEAMVVDMIDGLQQPEKLEAFLQQCREDWTKKLGFNSAELKRLESELRDSETAIHRWDKAYETGKLEFQEYLDRTQPHKERMKIIQDQLARVNEIPAPPNRQTLVSGAIDFRRVWDLASSQERKALLMRVLPAFRAKIYLRWGRNVDLVPDV